MELYVLDKDLNMLGVIDDYESLVWERKYSRVGAFTLSIVPNKYNYNLLKKENILIKNDGSLDPMYIDDINLERDEDGIETLIIEGLGLLDYLRRRITQRKQKVSGNAETVIRTYVDTNAITTEPNRIIPHLKLGTNNNLGDLIEHNAHYKELLEEISNLAEYQELGIKLQTDLKTKDLIFNIYQGLDRTSEQVNNPRALFSKDYENIRTYKYNHSIRDYKNTCLVAGAGEDKNRKTLLIGDNNSGLDRYELFIDARDISDTKTSGDNEISIPIEEYNKLLKSRGEEKLSEHSIIESFEGEVLDNQGLIYKKDYDLGDKVTVYSNEWNILLHTRIIGITETYSSEGLNIDIHFGNKKPDILKKIKRRMT